MKSIYVTRLVKCGYSQQARIDNCSDISNNIYTSYLYQTSYRHSAGRNPYWEKDHLEMSRILLKDIVREAVEA